tara:strand:- start:946 stop:1686 length:741 start_codon:yes stop_codon:yes gene_type:complete
MTELSPKRTGRVTASRFKDVMSEPRTKKARDAGELSESAMTYLGELLAERITGRSADNFVGNAATTWGNDFEPHARAVYAEYTGNAVTVPDFQQWAGNDSVGCSPDGFVGSRGGLEIKCPHSPKEHLRTWFRRQLPPQYIAQVQGSMWVTEREWWDFVSFDPRYAETGQALVILRVKRSEEFIALLERACLRFLAELDRRLAEMTAETVKPSEAPAAETYSGEALKVARLCVPPIQLKFQSEVIKI